MFRSVIFPILPAFAGIALGFWLDYLNKKYPHLLGGDSRKKQTDTPAPRIAPKPTKKEDIRQVKPEPARPPSAPPPCGCLINWACAGLHKLAEDAYDTLYQCQVCGQHYYIDNCVSGRCSPKRKRPGMLIL